MRQQELKKLLEKNKEHLVATTLEAMKESLTTRNNSSRTDIVIDTDTGEVSSHYLTSPSETLRGVFEGYMVVVTSVSMSDISDWANEYFAGSDVPDVDKTIEVYLDEYDDNLKEAASEQVVQGIGELLHYWQE